MTSTTILPDGTKLRTSSQRRYVAFVSRAGKFSPEARSDNLATIRKRFDGELSGYERVLVDTHTGEILKQVTKDAGRLLGNPK